MSTHAQPDRETARLVRDRDVLEAFHGRVLAALERHGYAKASAFAIRLALEEAIANAFNHGHKALPAHTPVTVEYAITDSSVSLAVQDQGPGFNPAGVPDPTLDENLETPSGRGLMLMKNFMESVRYNASGNRVEMVYRKPRE